MLTAIYKATVTKPSDCHFISLGNALSDGNSIRLYQKRAGGLTNVKSGLLAIYFFLKARTSRFRESSLFAREGGTVHRSENN